MKMGGASALALAAGFSPPPPIFMQKFGHAMKLKNNIRVGCVRDFVLLSPQHPNQDFYHIPPPPTDVLSCSVRQSAILWRVCNIVGRQHVKLRKIDVFSTLGIFKIIKSVRIFVCLNVKMNILLPQGCIKFIYCYFQMNHPSWDNKCLFFIKNRLQFQSKK